MQWRVVDLDENIVVFVGDRKTAREVFNEGCRLEVMVLLQKANQKSPHKL